LATTSRPPLTRQIFPSGTSAPEDLPELIRNEVVENDSEDLYNTTYKEN
jgi:hypothetical protein